MDRRSQTLENTSAKHRSGIFRQIRVGPGRAIFPQLWNIDRASLYEATVRVRESETTLDEESTRFGIREFHFDPATGFWLNGRNFKLKGICLHQDRWSTGHGRPPVDLGTAPDPA